MGITYFHKIKQLENGDFAVTTQDKERNPEHNWVMTYFREEYPDKDNLFRRAALLLDGQFCGSVYTCVAWQRKEAILVDFQREHLNSTGQHFHYDYGNRQGQRELQINEFAAYLARREKEPAPPKRKAKIKVTAGNHPGLFVENLTKRSRSIGLVEEKYAKIFNKPENDLQKLISLLPERLGAILVYC